MPGLVRGDARASARGALLTPHSGRARHRPSEELAGTDCYTYNAAALNRPPPTGGSWSAPSHGWPGGRRLHRCYEHKAEHFLAIAGIAATLMKTSRPAPGNGWRALEAGSRQSSRLQHEADHLVSDSRSGDVHEDGQRLARQLTQPGEASLSVRWPGFFRRRAGTGQGPYPPGQAPLRTRRPARRPYQPLVEGAAGQRSVRPPHVLPPAARPPHQARRPDSRQPVRRRLALRSRRSPHHQRGQGRRQNAAFPSHCGDTGGLPHEGGQRLKEQWGPTELLPGLDHRLTASLIPEGVLTDESAGPAG